MNYFTPDFYAAWAEGGLRAYCYLAAAMHFALARGDFVSAAELDWLQDVMDQKIASEIIGQEHSSLKDPPAVTPALNHDVIQQVRAVVRKRIKVREVLVA